MAELSSMSSAERLLWLHGVRSPEHIDLETIAAAHRAKVVYRQLDGCAARLVASADRAVISVAADDNVGRQRFSLGHELAHWICDAARGSFRCADSDIGPQNAEAKTIEANANNYASQLILPDYMVTPWLGARAVSLDLAGALASEFRASLTASAIRLTRRAKAPTVIACHDQTRLRWFLRNLSFPQDFFVSKQLHHDTAAFEIAFGKSSGMSRPKRESADRWFSGPGTYRREVTSQSVRLPDASVLSLISLN
ncbi:MAG: ImmA/IrrE family metallo-endopeptidase [Moraxellaceae bacterium]|nr:ImmA/IrrE family metallo-endopeptidase [Moraxellaceae bacterium]